MRPLNVPAAWTGADSLRAYHVARLDELVEHQAARTPDAPAIRAGSTIVRYAELIRQARRLARVLRAYGVRRDDLVAVCVDRSIEQIVSVLGVLLANAAYVPIDPQGPIERSRLMLEDSHPRAIVATAAFAASIRSDLREIVVALETLDDVHDRLPDADSVLPPIGTPQDLAYVIYTSGSTGTPKGVDSINTTACRTTWPGWRRHSRSPRTTACSRKTPAAFDVSVWEWFWPLSQGACLVLTPSRQRKRSAPPARRDRIARDHATSISCRRCSASCSSAPISIAAGRCSA